MKTFCHIKKVFKYNIKVFSIVYFLFRISILFILICFFVVTIGIYAYVHGEYLGYHSVKILGWGQENGINYWLVANSWGKEYGQEGFFKIRRGINECFIEGKIVATRLRV